MCDQSQLKVSHNGLMPHFYLLNDSIQSITHNDYVSIGTKPETPTLQTQESNLGHLGESPPLPNHEAIQAHGHTVRQQCIHIFS